MKNNRGGRFLIAGGGGREAAFAVRLAEDSVVCAVVPHENPTIVDCVRQTGGVFLRGDSDNPETLVRFAKEQKIDYAFVNADAPLANGAVDALLQNGIQAVGGRRDAARIEWDKIFAMTMMRDLLPRLTPFHKIAEDEKELAAHFSEFESNNIAVVVKPRGLTGGKGVKVMPAHLPTYQDALAYARELLQRDGQVLLVEKLHGKEFTIMGFCDGNKMAFAPPTYDYPYRFAGDTGPGTGGMGCFTAADGGLPFLTADDIADCREAMRAVAAELRKRGAPLQGALNGGFFKTEDGVRFMEFNSRLGDPEALNILSLLEGSFSGLLKSLWHESLDESRLHFAARASVVKYLVAKEYPNASPASLEFSLDKEAMEKEGVKVYFSSAEKTASGYATLKRSRVAALVAVADKVKEASQLVNSVIRRHVGGSLEFREDIGEDFQAD